jgi:predicted PurR-regulated permease PerM
MERYRWFRVLVVLLTIIAGLHLAGLIWDAGQRFGDIIVMFFLAWLLAFVLTPLTQWIERSVGLPRVLAAAGVYMVLFVALLGALVLIVPALVTQLLTLGKVLPAYAEQVPRALAQVQADLNERHVDVDITGLYRSQDLSAYLAGIGATAVQNAVGILSGVFNAVFAVVLVLALSFYIVVDGDLIELSLLYLVPDEYRGKVDFFIDSVNRSFGGFLRGTLIQAVVYGLGTALVMLLTGMDFVLVASLFAGVVMVIPIFGPFLAIIPPVTIALISAPVETVLFVVGGLLILQQFTFNVLAPKLMSESLGMHPLLVFAALLIGGRLAGLTGAIFGVPVAAVLWAMLRQAIESSRYGQLASERYSAAEQARQRHAGGDQTPNAGQRLRRTVIVFFQRVRLGP